MDVSPKWGDWGKCWVPYFLTRVVPSACLPLTSVAVSFSILTCQESLPEIIWVLPSFGWTSDWKGEGAQMNRAGCYGFTMALLGPESLKAILNLFLFPLALLLTISRKWLRWISLFSAMSTVWYNKAPVLSGLAPLNASAMLTVSKAEFLFAACIQMVMFVFASELMHIDLMYFLR